MPAPLTLPAGLTLGVLRGSAATVCVMTNNKLALSALAALLLVALVSAGVFFTLAAPDVPVRSALNPTSPTPSSSPSETLEACKTPAPTTALGYQEMFDSKNDMAWSGADQSTTLVLPDGRVLWVFSDTIQGTEVASGGYAPGWRMVHNSLVLQDGGCLQALNGPDGKEVVPNASNGDFYWPQQAVVDDGEVLIFSLRVKKTGETGFSFEILGTEVAVFSLPTDRSDTLEFLHMESTPSTGAPETSPQYGAALAQDESYHYVYGSEKVEELYHLGRSVHVARAPQGYLLDTSSWTYWDGTTWSEDPSSSSPIVESAPAGWSTSFTVELTTEGYKMVTKENDFLGTEVITGTSASPTGPFTREVILSTETIPNLTYVAISHPGLSVDGGRLGSYSRNSDSLTEIAADADLYKPQFFVIP